jgi:ubiquinone/menaquinone biosynthesis C-methylase UbiE
MTGKARGLTTEEARKFYDAYGARQEGHRHEDLARSRLAELGSFESACNVFELGCGTASFARDLLAERLPSTARYFGVDVSETMIRLAYGRLENFYGRIRLEQTEGELDFPEPAAFYDRYIACYVLDLLPEDRISEALEAARRLLAPDGLLCAVCLTRGEGVVQRAVSGIWQGIQKFSPSSVGGCRPIDLREFLPREQWSIEHNSVVSAFGVPSQVLIARPR